MTSVAPRRFRFAPILTGTVLTVLLLWLFGSIADLLLLLFLAILISLYLGAVADFFVRRFRLPRGAALGVALAATLAGVVGLFWLLVPPVIEQTQQLVKVLPNYIENWETGIDRAVAAIPALGAVWTPGEHKVLLAVYEQLSGMFTDVVPKVFGLVHGFINVFSVLVMAIYLSFYPGLYREWLIALFPPIHRDLARDVLGDLAVTLRSWIVGQLIAMAVLAVLTAIGLYILDVPYWLTFGVFTGVVAIVPFFGTLVSTLLPALFVMGGDGWGAFGPGGHAVLVALLGVVIHLLEGQVIMPLITSKKVNLPPVLTIMAVLVVGKVMGPAGLLVAVPVLAVLMVVVQRILITRIYEGQGFRRTQRDRALVLRVPAPEGGVLTPDGPPVDIFALTDERVPAVAG